MDVDDVEGKLAQQFGCMGTVDHEVLVREFQQILGPNLDLSRHSCAFFLDMNNWNLQAAVGSFYDLAMNQNGASPLSIESILTEPPAMLFVRDITIGEGQSVPKDTRFVKTWRIKNPGPKSWPNGCFLKHIEGPLFADSDAVNVPCLAAGEEGDVSVEMRSPSGMGIYQSRWQLNTLGGLPFGETIWCIIVVDEGGLLGITQQMASTTCGDSMDASTSVAPHMFSATSQSPNATVPHGRGIFGGDLKLGDGGTTIGVTPSQSDLNQHDSGGSGSAPAGETTECFGFSASTSTLTAGVSINRLTASPVSPVMSTGSGENESSLDYNAGTPSTSFNQATTEFQSGNLESSILATRGSPVPPLTHSFLDYDPPASPNGSSSLYAAVAAAVPYWNQNVTSEIRQTASPIDIPFASGSGTFGGQGFPRVPPCTPSSPSMPRGLSLHTPPQTHQDADDSYQGEMQTQ